MIFDLNIFFNEKQTQMNYKYIIYPSPNLCSNGRTIGMINDGGITESESIRNCKCLVMYQYSINAKLCHNNRLSWLVSGAKI